MGVALDLVEKIESHLIMRHYERRLRVTAYQILRDRDLTDDAVQDVFVAGQDHTFRHRFRTRCEVVQGRVVVPGRCLLEGSFVKLRAFTVVHDPFVAQVGADRCCGPHRGGRPMSDRRRSGRAEVL